MAYLFDTVQYLSFGTIKDSFFWYFIPSGVSPRPIGVDRLSAEGVVLDGGKGADTITLATGSQTMIYLIESDSENKKVTLFDGADVINAYEHTTDRLLFVDANERGLGARAELADATGLNVTFLTDGSDYTGFTLTDEDGVMLTVNLAANIQGSDAAALQAAIADTAQSDLSVLLQYFLPENQFDITIDTSPGSITLL